MGSQLYCTGPAHVWLQISPGGAPSYLGTCEESPDIEIRPEFEPVRNDIGGVKVPFDMSYQGEDALIVLDLNRWDEDVLRACQALPGTSAGGNTRGQSGPLDVGTLMLTESKTIPVYIVFPFNSKPAMARMPQGYRFFAAYNLGPHRNRPLGTRPRKVLTAFHAIRSFDPAHGTFLLYDEDVSVAFNNGLPGS